MSAAGHKEVYYMEDILKEENGSDQIEPDFESETGQNQIEADFDSETGTETGQDREHDNVRFSPEKEQALQTLDEVIQAAEESMSK